MTKPHNLTITGLPQYYESLDELLVLINQPDESRTLEHDYKIRALGAALEQYETVHFPLLERHWVVEGSSAQFILESEGFTLARKEQRQDTVWLLLTKSFGTSEESEARDAAT